MLKKLSTIAGLAFDAGRLITLRFMTLKKEIIEQEDSLVKAVDSLCQMGEELAFALPGKDRGLLAINRCLMEMEDGTTEDYSPAYAAGLSAARQWIDATLDGSAKFSAETLERLNQWQPWMLRVLDAWEHGESEPTIPSQWTTPPPATSPASSKIGHETGPETEERSITLKLEEDGELLREFHSESAELLQAIEEGLITLETNPSDPDTINSVFRAFHTFKGGAGFLHLQPMQDLAHELESLLAGARRGELVINSGIIDLILAGGDALKDFTQKMGEQLEGNAPVHPIVVPTSRLIQRLQATVRGENTPPPPQPETTDGRARAASQEKSSSLSPRQSNPPVGQDTSESGFSSLEASGGFVKLDTAKLDSLVDLVGELVIAQSLVVQNPLVQNLADGKLANSLRQLSRTTAELQRNALSLRMVPVRGAFQKMSRLVRDLASQQGKQIQLVLDGEETEIDRHIVEKLADPLVHMIRNSVDHGLETPEERMAAGKLSLGTIVLSAGHQRGGICIRIRDDGKGLNAERILAQARQSGLVGAMDQPDESAIYQMIFSPGFSTAEKVTDLSGRGVGMDVVRRNIEKLRGKIEIESVAGEGTTFTIILPLTLAIIDGLIVGLGGERYIIPILSVRESFRPHPNMVSTIQGRGEVVRVRGQQTPVLRLGKHLSRPSHAINPEEGIMVVVESGDTSRALLVDQLIGKQEVVIKNLGQSFQNQSLLAGAAVLGDGSVGLILDVDSLVRFSERDKNPPSQLTSPSA